MAQVTLSGIGRAVGGAPGAMVGDFIGRSIDQAIISSLQPARQRGPRLDGLKLQNTSEGAPMACVLGRARVVGQVIWAARFLEDRHTASAGKGGPRTVEYGYSLSFAVALCEGEIDGIGRVWADGQPMNLSAAAMRVHRGGENQEPDPLIEAVEGAAPAYRGTAYVVFEDLPLAPFGNRIPQLAFEVFKRPRGADARLEDLLEGVCLIPAAGEFILATETVMRREGLTRTKPENVHAADGRTDLAVSLDHLQAQAPNLKRVSLVIGWFGDDLRAGHCRVRPGVDRSGKATEPLTWSVAGLERQDAHLISTVGGAPAYGGTPCDASVRQAVAELKARGLEVTLYPFVFMDIPAANTLPDLAGGMAQPAYPWRGRLKGRDGPEAANDVAAVFGTPDDWGLRRLALHYADLAAETGADGLLIGSEMRGLTMTRDADGAFPAVAALRGLAAECRTVAGPSVRLSYAADWSEYAGVHEGGEVRFHLDPLWADPNIDYVGIDWYPPLGDWRGGNGGLDAALYDGPDDPLYLADQMAGGEGFDWFYASDGDRVGQVRTPIADGLANEDWIYRVKDVAGWWGHSHHERTGGVRDASPTAWVPRMKPIRLTEFGCPAVDRGGNAPNLFQDPKSVENTLPPFSTGARDDRMQRRALAAVLQHFAANNPMSAVYGGPMLEAADVWCWDARPWPAFPARGDIWADASAWRCGHWLNGRLHGETRDLIHALLRRGGVDDFEIGAFTGEVDGYLIDRPMTTREALAPLLAGLGLQAVERDGRIAAIADEPVSTTLRQEALALSDEGGSVRVERNLEARPSTARVRFIDGARDYQTGSAIVRIPGEGGGLDLDLPAVCGPALAEAAAHRALMAEEGEHLKVLLGPLEALRLEVGDKVAVEGKSGLWRVISLDVAETVSARLDPVRAIQSGEDLALPVHSGGGVVVGAPFFRMLELPHLGDGEATGPLAVVAADPWRPMQVRAGPSTDAMTLRADIDRSATVGVLLSIASPGPRHRWDRASTLTIRIEGRAPESRSEMSVLAGANALAVETSAGWELIQFQRADLIGDGVWRLSSLLRGQQGTEAATRAGAAAGAVVVLLDGVPSPVLSPQAERGLPLLWRAGPIGLPGGAGVSEIHWTPSGRQDRPWSPAHLRRRVRLDGGIALSWIPRARVGGDRWDGGLIANDPWRFRIRVLRDGEAVRSFEVEETEAVFSAVDVAADFSGGLPADVSIGVAQWGETYGWGEEATLRL